MNNVSEMQRLHGELEQLSGWAIGAADVVNNHIPDIKKMVDELAAVKETLRVAEDKLVTAEKYWGIAERKIKEALEIAEQRCSATESARNLVNIYGGWLYEIRQILEGGQ